MLKYKTHSSINYHKEDVEPTTRSGYINAFSKPEPQLPVPFQSLSPPPPPKETTTLILSLHFLFHNFIQTGSSSGDFIDCFCFLFEVAVAYSILFLYKILLSQYPTISLCIMIVIDIWTLFFMLQLLQKMFLMDMFVHVSWQTCSSCIYY